MERTHANALRFRAIRLEDRQAGRQPEYFRARAPTEIVQAMRIRDEAIGHIRLIHWESGPSHRNEYRENVLRMPMEMHS